MATQVTVITGEGSTSYSVSTGARGPTGATGPEGTITNSSVNSAIATNPSATRTAAGLVIGTDVAAQGDTRIEPQVKSSSFTASNGETYHVVASATVTDPSPVEGKGFSVLVRNGTATVGGTAYATAGTFIIRTFHSGTWLNHVYRESAYFGTLATQSGTFSGTSSGTNTGDQSSIVGITGTTAQFNTALTDGDFATLAGSETLTNKSIDAGQLTGDIAVARIATALTTPGPIGGTTRSTGAFTTLSATGVVTIATGSAAAPSIAFSGDSNTGIYQSAADDVRIATGGSDRIIFSNAGVNCLASINAVSTTPAAPAFRNGSFNNTGIYFPVNTTVGIATNALLRWSVNSSGELAADATNGGGLTLLKTITAPATTGARTINKSSGRVNFAAAATSLVVTNSLCTANSIIHCTIATNDATAAGIRVVAAAGSFAIHMLTAPTAETAVNFLLTN